MPEETPSSLIHLGDLGGLSKPCSLLIEKLSSAICGVCLPWQTVRAAKAEAEADLIRAAKDVQVAALRNRAAHRLLLEETERQGRLEAVVDKSLPFVNEKANPAAIEQGWLVNFADHVKRVPEDDMQGVWARILAGEANAPGSFSKRTLNILSEFGARDAEDFTKMSCFVPIFCGRPTVLVFDLGQSDFMDANLPYEVIQRMEAFGLITIDTVGFYQRRLPDPVPFSYFGRSAEVQKPATEDDFTLGTGMVAMTQFGEELMKISGPQPVDGYFEYLLDYWKQEGIIVTEITDR
ncbi:MAG: DUF2806 domain-containing protein [Prosthecobacter sp.]|nr:DUF2806 domain-containing protein [Prosthecobacter sp.]